MKTTLIALMLVLSLAATAEASLWDFSWISEWTGRTVSSERTYSNASGQASGQATATVNSRPGGGVLVEFGTPAGTAQFGVDPSQPFPYVDSRLPFNVPANAGTPGGLQLLPGDAQAFPYGRDFQWTGDFKNPDSFSVEAVMPGSGPSPMLRFSGTGTRRAEASAPSAIGFIAAALGCLIWLRRHGNG